MKKKFYLMSLAALLFLCLSAFLVHESYAKYLTLLDETTNIKIARWRIVVNNTDIRDGNTATGIITPVFLPNEHIAENIIAPNSEGYFDLIIDSSNADVSFKYSLSVTTNADSDVQDLVVTGYSINNGTKVEASTNPLVENTILYSSGTTTTTIRVFIKWDDSDSASMDNAADTLAANGTAKLDISLSFTQLAS